MSTSRSGALDLELMHKAGTYLMVASTFCALWLGKAFGPVVGGLVATLGVASWFWELPRMDPARFGRAWTGLTIVFLLFCGYLLFFTEQGFVQVGVYLVLYLTSAKLFQRARLVDYLQLFALSFLLLAAATAFNEDLTFGLFFIVYVVCGVITFAMHHLRVQLEENHARGGMRTRQLFGRQYLTVLSILAVLIFGASVAFFFLFPRMGFGFFVQKSREGAQTSGFSESVNLGSHGAIKSDNTVVMRVEFPLGRPDDTALLHWRGISFDHYDGYKWSSTLKEELGMASDMSGSFEVPGAVPHGIVPAGGERGRVVDQRIYLEPIGSAVMFGLHDLERIELSEKDKTAAAVLFRHQLTWSPGGDVRHYQRARPRAPFEAPSVGYFYTATSRLPSPSPEALAESSPELRAVGLNEEGGRAWVQLPERSERVAELARQVTEGAPNDYERVRRIETWLKTSLTYTTDLPDPGDQSPLDAFLFVHKRGHCEYFATAMVIMVRSLGIPARNVNGFLGGQWNDFDDFLAVRNADAHSWVEVYFPGAGWLEFDPTPAGANVSDQSSFWDPALELWDSLRFKWTRYVIEYDLETQVEFLRKASQTLGAAEGGDERPEEFAFTLRDLLTDLRQNLLPGVLVIVFALGAAVVIRVRRPLPIDQWDGMASGAAIGASVAIVQALWRPEAGAAAFVFAVGAPLLLSGIALWQRRARRAGPSRAAVAGVARHYTALRDAIGQTPVEVARTDGPERLMERVRASDLPEREAIVALIVRYMEVRFGGKPLDASAERTYGREASRLAKLLRRHRREKRA